MGGALGGAVASPLLERISTSFGVYLPRDTRIAGLKSEGTPHNEQAASSFLLMWLIESLGRKPWWASSRFGDISARDLLHISYMRSSRRARWISICDVMTLKCMRSFSAPMIRQLVVWILYMCITIHRTWAHDSYDERSTMT